MFKPGPGLRPPSILVVLACVMVLALQGWIEWTAGATQMQATKSSLANLAGSLAQDAEDTIDIADTAVENLVVRLEAGGTAPDTLSRIGQELRAQAGAWTRYRAMIILGTDGEWLASSLPTKSPGGFDRAYFQHHFNDPGREPFIGPPIQNRINGDWSITVSRRFQTADGGFGGVVLALVSLSYFTDHFTAVDLGRNSAISLFATDGTLLARVPHNDKNVGTNFANGVLFAKYAGAVSGSLVNTALTDGIRRVVGFRRSTRYPFIITAGIWEELALAGWHSEMRTHMLIATLLTGTIGFLGMYLTRQTHRSLKAEEQVRASEARYRQQAETLQEANERVLLATDSGAIGLWEWNLAIDRMTWDPWMYRLRGIQPSIHDPTYALWKRHVHPDDLVAAEQAVRDSIEGGRPYGNEFRVIWPDGSIRHIRGSGQVKKDTTGKIIRLIGANWDVTALRLEEEKRAVIIEAAPNGMMIVDEAGVISLANSQAEMLFDYPHGSLVGQSAEILMPGGFRFTDDLTQPSLADAKPGNSSAVAREVIAYKQNGTPVTLEIMLSSVKTPRGRILIASLIDITERIRLAEQKLDTEKRERQAVEEANAKLDRLARHLAQARDRAEQASRAKSRFLAGMSHELRTPLNGILGYAQLLHMDGGLTPTQTARVDAMLGAGRHLLEMITCVLDLSQIEADHVVLQAVTIDVRAVAEACLDLVRPTAEAKALTLELAVAPDMQRDLVADPVRLRQVLLNLLGNAAKFTIKGSINVRLRPAADDALLRIEVADTGPGIKAEQRARLFQDFERLDSEATSVIEGAGLGLALSARLATLMGGRLGHDANPGGGSVFWLELPWGTPASSAPAAAPAFNRQDGNACPPAVRALRVLVVDDVAMNRDIASSFLRAVGHEATCVEDGAEAIATAAANDFDVVLMDVRMPRMDGLEATRRIRALAGPRGQVPIVALTAQAFTDQVEACREAGMDSHLGKPFDMDTLLEAISNALKIRQSPESQSSDPGPTKISATMGSRADLTTATFSSPAG